MNKADIILAKIKEEVISSLKKHPKWPDDPFHALSILGEEFGEISKALLEHYGTNQDIRLDDIRMELIQLGAMCVRMLDGLDRVPVRIQAKAKEQSDQTELIKDKSFEHLTSQGIYMNPQMALLLNRGPVKATIVDSKGNEHTLGAVTIKANPDNKFRYLDTRFAMVKTAVQITPKLWVSQEKGDVPSEWEKLDVTRTHGNVFGNHTLVLTGKKGIEKRPATNIAKIGDWVITKPSLEDRWLSRGVEFERVDTLNVEVVNDNYFKYHFTKIG